MEALRRSVNEKILSENFPVNFTESQADDEHQF